ncbi:hypothetical protein [Hymenobacter terrenus]|uniref:hypothetical protein n=1 Tax=Hymenobacter terrenus TaxID=1629124 RepID=UPI000B2CA8A8|nr:hypothetical protein [Hymenobacter terrenus]
MSPESTPPLLQLTSRPDLGILIGRWGYQPAPTELPAVYEALAAAALRENSCFWLQDIRRRTLNDPYTTQWLLADYFPDIARRLQRRLCVSYLVSPSLHQTILETPGFLPPEAYEGRPFALSFSGDEGTAIQWLQLQQARVVG